MLLVENELANERVEALMRLYEAEPPRSELHDHGRVAGPVYLEYAFRQDRSALPPLPYLPKEIDDHSAIGDQT